MRPVLRGEVPKDDKGNEVTFTEYAQARRYLIDRIGEYCSYCERKIQASLAVEHVQPKDSNPSLTLSWNNFLLGCTNCNSTKGKKEVVIEHFVWPDIDPTFNYFSYDESGIVKVNKVIRDADLRHRIEKTIKLVGLQKPSPKIGTRDWEKASDRRNEHRIKAYINSRRYRDLYRKVNQAEKDLMLDFIRTIVIADGFWTIWMQAFNEFPEMIERLKNCIPGTRL